MAVADVGSTSVFQSPGIGSIGPTGQAAPPSPAPVVPDSETDAAQPASPQVLNTDPSEDDRKKAEAQGNTRGSFVDIRA